MFKREGLWGSSVEYCRKHHVLSIVSYRHLTTVEILIGTIASMVSQLLNDTEGYVEYIFSMWLILFVLFSLYLTNLTSVLWTPLHRQTTE